MCNLTKLNLIINLASQSFWQGQQDLEQPFWLQEKKTPRSGASWIPPEAIAPGMLCHKALLQRHWTQSIYPAFFSKGALHLSPETVWKSGADLVHTQQPPLCLLKPEVEWWGRGTGSRIKLGHAFRQLLLFLNHPFPFCLTKVSSSLRPTVLWAAFPGGEATACR